MTTIKFLLWNLFLALILWKGIEGNKTAQYIFCTLNWIGVILLFIAYNFRDKLTAKQRKDGTKATSPWLGFPVSFGFMIALVYYGWIWTALAVVMEFVFVQDLRSELKNKIEEEETQKKIKEQFRNDCIRKLTKKPV